MTDYVIIGNGIAAAGAVEGIRKFDKTGSVAVISGESHHVYSRPLISYYLMGKTDAEHMKYRPDSFYTDNGVKLIFGSAVKIDAVEKTVALSNGSVIKYGSLLYAAGSTPFTPRMDGIENVEKKFEFYTFDDALKLEKAIFPTARVLIIGAGLIGLKCAEGLYGKVGEITVVDLQTRILSSILDEKTSKPVQKYLEEKGLKFIFGDSVKSFDGNTAHLNGSASVGFDILVTAVGVRANTSLLQSAGAECGRGICIDSRCRTSLPNVYAAGDCTESVGVLSDARRVIAILPDAYMQGECAGKNMAGEDAEFTNAIPMNSMGLLGLHIMTAGSYEGECYEAADGGIKELFYHNDRLYGFIIIGDTSRAGIYTALIRNKTPLSGFDFPLICKEPALAAFSAERRGEMLRNNKQEKAL